MGLRFHKMHGLGNDFVVIDARAEAVAIDAARVRVLADRRTGIGCDQLILVGPPADDADVTMRIWNADGSEVAACGNATRCVPVLVGRDVTVRTAAGVLDARRSGDGAAVDMGVPLFDWDAIPLAYSLDTACLPVAWGLLANPAVVNVGNPHAIFFVDADPATVPLETLGPQVETDPLFPERINVTVARIEDRARVTMRTWERGAGLTQACGTAACATFAAGRRLGRFDRQVTLALPGGALTLAETAAGHLLMTGPACHVFTGETAL